MASRVEDKDCPDPKVCFVNVSWLLEEGVESDCLCGNWNSFIGEDCLGFGPGAIYYICSVCVTMLMALFGFSLSIWTWVELWKQHNIRFNTQVTTNAFTALAFLFIISWRCVTMIKTTTPEDITLLVTENLQEERKQHSTRYLEFVMIYLSVVFGLLAAINISLNWIDIAMSARRLSKSSEIALSRYRFLAIASEALWAVLSAVLFAQSAALVFVGAAPLLLLLVVSYGYGGWRMTRMLKRIDAENSNSKFAALSQRITLTVNLMISGTILLLIGGTSYTLLVLIPEEGWKEVSPYGKISPVLITNETFPFTITWLVLSVQYFLWSNSISPISRADSVANANSVSERTTKSKEQEANSL